MKKKRILGGQKLPFYTRGPVCVGKARARASWLPFELCSYYSRVGDGSDHTTGIDGRRRLGLPLASLVMLSMSFVCSLKALCGLA